jgi:murein DD-endopeptidase MepM/ murein hydrolase activator NlpD
MIDLEETFTDVPAGAVAPPALAVEADGEACGVCNNSLRATRYVHVEAWSMYVLCSVACFRTVVRECGRVRWAERRRYARGLAVAAILAGGFLTPHGGRPGSRHVARAAPAPRPSDPSPAALPPGWFGPEWPPTDESSLAALGMDAWIHPLAGPVRRMPRADSRVFGAVRPGDRPAECRNGHCGVDLGGEIWGEHVHAVHDGVVDFVQRNANPDRGGEFVRLAHRDGTVFTQYFHLAAIPRGLERGVHVKSGDVIGLLGDTGVKESAPHLHFAISVRPAKEWPERYIDPEPLIALWPVRVPIDGGEAGLVSTVARPGLPLGSALLSGDHRRKLAKLAKLKRGARDRASGGADAEGQGERPASAEDSTTDAAGEGAPAPSGDE